MLTGANVARLAGFIVALAAVLMTPALIHPQTQAIANTTTVALPPVIPGPAPPDTAILARDYGAKERLWAQRQHIRQARKAEAARRERARERAREAQRAATKDHPATHTAVLSGSWETIVRALTDAGSASCAIEIFTRESGGNPHAENPSSGAYGIPQALPGSKMASAGADWADNPVTQIRWGLDYMTATYGSACGAWAYWQAHGAY